MSGPKVNPRPNAAPMSAIPLARRSGGVQSAMTAAAVLTLAPATPAPIRLSRIRARASVPDSGGRVEARPNSP